MSSGRHEVPAGGSGSRPDVLSETTDLDTLFEAIVGKPNAPTPAVEPERRPQPLIRKDDAPRAKAPLPDAPSPIVEPERSFEWPPAAPTAGVPASATATMAAVQPAESIAFEETEDAVDEDDELAVDEPVGRLEFLRRSPWPIMVILGGMALVTVSAIGLRSGSSPTAEVPPAVAPPPMTQPDGYAAQLPAAQVPPIDAAAQPGTAIGESPLKPSGPTARGATAAAASTPVTPPPAMPVTPPATAAAKPAAAAATRPAPPAPSAPAPAVFAPPPAATETPAPAPTARTEEKSVVPGADAVRLIEPPAPPPEPRTEPPAPIATPPAVSSARPATTSTASEAVVEVPKPAPPRTVVPMVAARRLTGGMPEYASALRQQKIGGVVEVQIRIDLNGRVVSAIAASGPPPLRQAAEAAVLKWRYAPATRNGIPIETESKVTFSFDPSQNRRP